MEPDPKWKPAHYTPRKSEYTIGDDFIDFAEAILKVTSGKTELIGQPLIYTEWQQWLLRSIFELTDEGKLRYRTVIIGLPRKNGKSLLMSSIITQQLIFGQPAGQIYSAATDRETAKIVYEEVERQIKQSPLLQEYIRIRSHRIEVPSTNTIYRALSSDASKQQGLSPTLVGFDELHAIGGISGKSKRGDELYTALTEGSANRENPILIGITTAGGNKDTFLGQLYEYGVKVAAGEIDDDSFGFYWWEADEKDDPTDPETWRKANPNLAEGLMDYKDFETSIKRANATNYASFQRYRLNMWVRSAGESFITPYYWGEAERDKTEEIKEGEEVFLGFDGSINNDATGLVAINKKGTLKVLGLWEEDPTNPEWIVDRAHVKITIEEAFKKYNVLKLWADPAYYEELLLELSKKHPRKVERIPMSPSRITPMAREFIADVIEKNIGHTGDKNLTRHVLNAVQTEGGSFKKEKPKSPHKVDLLACSILANGARHAYKPKTAKRAMRVL